MQQLKKLAAILLIAVLFFNWYGYRLLTGYWQQAANQRLENRLDNNDYDESSLISFKLPVTKLTYYEQADTWERTDGELILGNVAYKYVKWRIHNDSIELLCIRNVAQMQLGEAGNAFFRLVNNLLQFPDHKAGDPSGLLKVYTVANFSLRIPPPPVAPGKGINTPSSPLPAGFTTRWLRPPVGSTLL